MTTTLKTTVRELQSHTDAELDLSADAELLLEPADGDTWSVLSTDRNELETIPTADIPPTAIFAAIGNGEVDHPDQSGLLKSARATLGWSQADLGRRLGLSIQHEDNPERGAECQSVYRWEVDASKSIANKVGPRSRNSFLEIASDLRQDGARRKAEAIRQALQETDADAIPTVDELTTAFERID